MTVARYLIGDTLAVLPTLEPASVDTVICSPPFLALRSYLPAGHPDKALEHGSEPTPAAFLANLLDVTELLGRVLAPHGSIAVELGDTYSGARGYGNEDSQNPAYGERSVERWRDARVDRRFKKQDDGWPLPKSLCFVPQLYGASLAYGRNMLAAPGSPEWREFEPWRVRNVVAWVRPNPPVGALGDKWRPATSHITVATRSARRYWDDVPTRRPHTEPGRVFNNNIPSRKNDSRDADGRETNDEMHQNPAGAPLLDWWEITPSGFTSRLGTHYATFPDAIAVPLVEAMCPRRVCRTCGQPSRRLQSKPDYVPSESYRGGAEWADTERVADGVNQWVGAKGARASLVRSTTTVGWSTCGCPGTEQTRDDGFHDGAGWRAGVVLDPYAGTGTSLLVATGHGREAVGVDLDGRNAALAEERLGMFVTVEEPV